MNFNPTLVSPTPTWKVLEAVANHFKVHPACIAEQYDTKDADENRLIELAEYCANPYVWFEDASLHEGCSNPDGTYTFQRGFYIHDSSVLENHGYCDEDSVWVVVEETLDPAVYPPAFDISVMCH